MDFKKCKDSIDKNLLSIAGWLGVLTNILLYLRHKGSTMPATGLIDFIGSYIIFYVVFSIGIFMYIIELILNHQIKSDFILNNKFYSVFWIIGAVFSAIFIFPFAISVIFAVVPFLKIILIKLMIT